MKKKIQGFLHSKSVCDNFLSVSQGHFFKQNLFFLKSCLVISNHTGMDEIRVQKKKSILFNTTSSCHVQLAVKLNVKPEIYGP